MIINASELREREVVNICDGKRLGYVCDFQINTENGKICAIYVADHSIIFSGQRNLLRIEWDKISCIGEDTILVNIICEECKPEFGKKDKKCRGKGFFNC